MSILRDLFTKLSSNREGTSTVMGVSGTPAQVFTVGDAWNCDTVQQAIQRIIAELLKYHPIHTEMGEFGEHYPVNSDLSRILNNPNEWDTGQDMMEKLYYQYFLNGNAYIIPTSITYKSGHRVITGLYNIKPSEVEHVEDASGVEGYRFTFQSGYCVEFPACDVIHLKRQYGKNDYFGGDVYGRPDSNALKETIKLNYNLLNGVVKAVNSSMAVNGVIKVHSQLDINKQNKYLEEFYEKLKAGNTGFIVMDNKSTLEQFKADTKIIDAETLKFIDSKILRTYGVSQAILSGDYTCEQLSAFRSSAIEPVINKLQQELTKKLLTRTERVSGQTIQFYQNEIRHVDTHTVDALNLLTNTGSITANELRRAVGLPPLRELSKDKEGHPLIMMSKNWGTKNSVMNQVTIEAGLKGNKKDEQETDMNSIGDD